jgi:hypothetical protein
MVYVLLLWHVPVAGQRPQDKQTYNANKHVCTATVGNSNRGTVFSVRCMQDSWSNELVVGQSPAGKNVSTEADDIVGSVTRQRVVKTQQTEKT